MSDTVHGLHVRSALDEHAPASYPDRSLAARGRRAASLGTFFAGLVVKEHVAPSLNVRPRVAELFLTENCNLRCISCACWRDHTRHELTTAEWLDVIGQLARIGIVKVNFTGGEPLLRRDAVGLMAAAARAGIGEIHLNSNAILLDEAMLDRVIAAGVRSFNISVDGPDAAVHDAVRGRAGAFDTTIRHLRAVTARREELGLKVRMNFTVMRSNAEHLPRMADLAREVGARLYLNLATDTTFLFRDQQVSEEKVVDDAALARALVDLERREREHPGELPRYSELRYIPAHFRDVVRRDVPCAESQLKLMVHSQGQVGGCWGHDPTMNVRERTLADVVTSRAYRDEHARLYRKDCVGCGSNYSLNVKVRPSSWFADRRWRAGRRSLAHDLGLDGREDGSRDGA